MTNTAFTRPAAIVGTRPRLVATTACVSRGAGEARKTASSFTAIDEPDGVLHADPDLLRDHSQAGEANDASPYSMVIGLPE